MIKVQVHKCHGEFETFTQLFNQWQEVVAMSTWDDTGVGWRSHWDTMQILLKAAEQVKGATITAAQPYQPIISVTVI